MFDTGISRRSALAGAGAVGLTAALTACGNDDGGTDDGTDTEPTTGAATRTTAPSGAAGTELAAATEVPVGGGTVFKDEKVVVVQPAAGTFVAFSAVCTHQGCAVSAVEKNEIICPCHNSRFSTSDGSVLSGPARQPLPARQVENRNGTLFVS